MHAIGYSIVQSLYKKLNKCHRSLFKYWTDSHPISRMMVIVDEEKRTSMHHLLTNGLELDGTKHMHKKRPNITGSKQAEENNSVVLIISTTEHCLPCEERLTLHQQPQHPPDPVHQVVFGSWARGLEHCMVCVDGTAPVLREHTSAVRCVCWYNFVSTLPGTWQGSRTWSRPPGSPLWWARCPSGTPASHHPARLMALSRSQCLLVQR